MEAKTPSTRPKIKYCDISGISNSSTSPKSSYVLNSPNQSNQIDIQNILETYKNSNSIHSKLTKEKSNIDITNYTLQNWRTYSLLRFDDKNRFQKSPHGKRIIIANALREYRNDVIKLIEYTDLVEIEAKKTDQRIHEEQERRQIADDMVSELQYKFAQLEANYFELEKENLFLRDQLNRFIKIDSNNISDVNEPQIRKEGKQDNPSTKKTDHKTPSINTKQTSKWSLTNKKLSPNSSTLNATFSSYLQNNNRSEKENKKTHATETPLTRSSSTDKSFSGRKDLDSSLASLHSSSSDKCDNTIDNNHVDSIHQLNRQSSSPLENSFASSLSNNSSNLKKSNSTFDEPESFSNNDQIPRSDSFSTLGTFNSQTSKTKSKRKSMLGSAVKFLLGKNKNKSSNESVSSVN